MNRMAGDVAHAPALWPLEFANVLRKAIGGKNISEACAVLIVKSGEAGQMSSTVSG